MLIYILHLSGLTKNILVNPVDACYKIQLSLKKLYSPELNVKSTVEEAFLGLPFFFSLSSFLLFSVSLSSAKSDSSAVGTCKKKFMAFFILIIGYLHSFKLKQEWQHK